MNLTTFSFLLFIPPLIVFFFSSVLEKEPTNEEGKSTLERVNSVIDEKNDSKKAEERMPAKKVFVVSKLA